MKLYAAIDLHSNNSVLVILDEQDRIVYEKRLPNALSLIVGALAPYRDRVQAIAVESTFNGYWLVHGLMDARYEVKLVKKQIGGQVFRYHICLIERPGPRFVRRGDSQTVPDFRS